METKISNCCGAAPIGNGDMSLEDVGICSNCRDHCEYITETEYALQGLDEDERWFRNHLINVIAHKAQPILISGADDLKDCITFEDIIDKVHAFVTQYADDALKYHVSKIK